MKLSIVVPVLNSHEIVRRQLLHFQKMGIPDGVEIIYMDDGSYPPLDNPGTVRNLRIVQTHDNREWTWAIARNSGAKLAQGDYLLMTDIDYIIPRKAIEDALAFNGDYMGCRREFGILDENGDFTQDLDTLVKYGLLESRIPTRGVNLPAHPNNFVIRKSLFWEMGGYREDRVGRPYPQGEDSLFKKQRCKFREAGKLVESEYRPTIYMFPNGQFCGDVDFNPFGLFHDLSRKTEANYWYKHPRN
jgi:glycosyltransferase involved in cell wall biosynthesis